MLQMTVRMFCRFNRRAIVIPQRQKLHRTFIQSPIIRLKTHLNTNLNLASQASSYNTVCIRTISTGTVYLQKQPIQGSSELPKDSSTDEKLLKLPEDEEKLGLFKRFHQAYKEHGKVLIAVHCATSMVWFGAFYYAAVSGVDLVPFLQKIGASERIIVIAHSSVGNLATMYLMYKLATPARYTVTLFGTYSSVRYLRKLGYLETPAEGDRIRELMKDGRLQIKEKYGDLKDDMKEKIDKTKEDVKDKLDKRKDDKRLNKER